ncbi:hypothetical protein Q7A53_05375 [Halobacillus rhizosphaerae]|uniref:hypothetical protein n=1 Tax=Halobacillus rhizosphaerae TaxID=3064889 RepID=UPI00398B8062
MKLKLFICHVWNITHPTENRLEPSTFTQFIPASSKEEATELFGDALNQIGNGGFNIPDRCVEIEEVSIKGYEIEVIKED